MMMILIFERERRREYVSLKGKKKWRINDRERARERKVLSTHQRGSSKPKQKSNQNHTHIRPIRDRGDRFPSFIDSFYAIRDCFRLGFECFFDRFCFLQHDDDINFFLNLFSFLCSLLIELETLLTQIQRDDERPKPLILFTKEENRF